MRERLSEMESEDCLMRSMPGSAARRRTCAVVRSATATDFGALAARRRAIGRRIRGVGQRMRCGGALGLEAAAGGAGAGAYLCSTRKKFQASGWSRRKRRWCAGGGGGGGVCRGVGGGDGVQAKGNSYDDTLKIRSIQRRSWWYYACGGCKAKTQPDGDRYKCARQTVWTRAVKKRYCLSFFGSSTVPTEEENNEDIEFICFGPTAEELIGISVDTLVELGGGVGIHTPPQITRLEGKIIKVSATCTRGSLQKVRPSFKVENILSMTEVPDNQPQVDVQGPVLPNAAGASSSQDAIATDTDATSEQANKEEIDDASCKEERRSAERTPVPVQAKRRPYLSPSAAPDHESSAPSGGKRGKKGAVGRKLKLIDSEEDA